MAKVNVNSEDLRKLIEDVAQIKSFLLAGEFDRESELSDWAVRKLSDARKRKSKVFHSEVKKRLLI